MKLRGVEINMRMHGKMEQVTERLHESNTAKETYIRMISFKKETRRYDPIFFNSSRYLVSEVRKMQKCMENAFFCKNGQSNYCVQSNFGVDWGSETVLRNGFFSI